MKPCVCGSLLAMWIMAGPAQATALYTGEWSYQALNAGDTSFKVEQQDSKITLYRVLHPEFEGERYKLEHMYRGTLAGKKIEGKLFVREEGMADFEFLRVFQGKVMGDDQMLMDDMPLKRIGGKVVKEAQPPPVEDSTPSPYAKVVINRGEKKAEPEPEPERTAQAPKEIPELIPVGRSIETPEGAKARKLLEEANGLFEKKKYSEAVKHYETVLTLDKGKVEALYKLGVGYGTLGVIAKRKGWKKAARLHYQKAIGYWVKAVRLDPYNYGAKENIKRAKKKLAAL